MGAESGMNSSVRDDRVALSDGAKALWGKTNRIDDSEWLPLYVHMVDSAAMASKIWDTWVPQGTKAVIVGDLGNDEVLARKLMIFMAGIHDIGKATPVFQAKPITFGPEAGSFAWKAERAGLPMIAGLRGTNHPTHPIAGEIILEGYLLRVRGWERKAARQYACVVGGHHGTPPDKSKIDEEKNRKTNVGLDSEVWISTQDELIDFVANIAGIEEKEWEDLSERRFSVQSAVLMTGLVIMADWIASNSDEDMFPLVRTEPWADEDEDFFFSESGEEDDIQSWSGLRIRADRAWSCVQLPHAWVPEGIPSSCQDLFATRFALPEGAKVRPVQEETVRIARDTRQPGLMVIEAPMGEGKTEAALAAAEILAQRTGRGGVCVALPTMATTDAMFTRVHRWLEALPSCDFDNEKTVWLAHGKAQLNNDFRGIIAASHRRFSSVDQDDVKQESSQNRKKKQIDVPPETVVSDWLWGRKKGALANFLVCTVDQVLMSALQMKHVVLRQLAMANKVVIIDECHAYDAYMQEYLKMALEWLGGYRTPVILLLREIIMFMDIHCIQQVPPSNINRDDTGSPKTAYVGGALRSRVSSQAWKRAMRGVFGNMLDSSRLGKRTKGVVTLIADSITSKRPDLAESAEGLAQKVMAAAGFKVKASDRAGADKGSLATDYLIFIANNEIDKLADLAIAAFDEGEDVSKMKKEVSAIFHGPQAVDIALFGRMLADAPDLNTDASAQVAHAFSIDQITPEYDYFTAVDDCASEDNAGAAMIDTVGFNSSTLYRYATVNIDALRDQLQDDSATVEGVVAFVEAFVKSMPSGKQNTFANHTLPEDVVVTLRESQPISAADAFEDPVRRKDGISVSRQGVERLGERLNDIRVNYGEEPVKAWYVATGGAVSSLNEWCEQVSLPDLEQSLKETLNAAYSA